MNELDNRGSTCFLATYWARALASQTEDAELAARFGPLADALEAESDTIQAELLAAQGSPVELGGYYRPDPEQAAAAMRPSATFNRLLASL